MLTGSRLNLPTVISLPSLSVTFTLLKANSIPSEKSSVITFGACACSIAAPSAGNCDFRCACAKACWHDMPKNKTAMADNLPHDVLSVFNDIITS